MEECEKSLLIPMQKEKKINKNEMAKAQILNGKYGNSVQYMLMFGNKLINYIPLEPITEISENHSDEVHFKNALYDFYTYCERGEIIYTETRFIKFFNLHNFKIPASVINFLDLKNILPMYEVNLIPFIDVRKIEPDKVVSYVNNDEITICSTYTVKNDIEYYLAIAYELLKHGYRIKRCIECGKWLIVINKKDTTYCPNCGIERQKKQKALNKLKSETLKRCRDRKLSTSVGAVPTDKKWEDLENEIQKQYEEANTIPEMEECSEWLKGVNKVNFRKARKNIEG